MDIRRIYRWYTWEQKGFLCNIIITRYNDTHRCLFFSPFLLGDEKKSHGWSRFFLFLPFIHEFVWVHSFPIHETCGDKMECSWWSRLVFIIVEAPLIPLPRSLNLNLNGKHNGTSASKKISFWGDVQANYYRFKVTAASRKRYKHERRYYSYENCIRNCN